MADWMADGWPVLWMRGAITRLACKQWLLLQARHSLGRKGGAGMRVEGGRIV